MSIAICRLLHWFLMQFQKSTTWWWFFLVLFCCCFVCFCSGWCDAHVTLYPPSSTCWNAAFESRTTNTLSLSLPLCVYSNSVLYRTIWLVCIPIVRIQTEKKKKREQHISTEADTFSEFQAFETSRTLAYKIRMFYQKSASFRP